MPHFNIGFFDFNRSNYSFFDSQSTAYMHARLTGRRLWVAISARLHGDELHQF